MAMSAMGEKFDFEKLDAYQEALEFADTIYRVTKAFPRMEDNGLTSQLRRAGVSIAANLAEGSARRHAKEKAMFYATARASAHECVPILEICRRQRYLSNGVAADLRSRCQKLSKMLQGLVNAMRRRK